MAHTSDTAKMMRNTRRTLQRWALAGWLALATTTLPTNSQGATATAAPGSDLMPTGPVASGPGMREPINLYPERKVTTSRTPRGSMVKVTEENLVLPTYLMGPAERNPIFYTQESYQGAQKRVYPYPMQDYLTETRTNRPYKAVKLENQYVQFTILPEIGGRLFEAVDKSNGYDIFYRQHVIKPALIGMLGAWTSGGIEWCAFHHHRNTTFLPVDYQVSTNADGSKTVWFGETERRHRMRWLIGLTLYPDKSYIEATVKFLNRTPLPHSILYWANVAVHVNDDYQIIFPPSVQTATYHSKIDFSHWPIGMGKYQGVDYQGVDLSWWKNHPEPVSFFAWNLAEDFMGGYDHGRNAGVVHVGNHHVVTGAKLWEWGTGPFGRRWDKILTDEDGPYAELMVGAWSDNQPDYSWIKPYEVKVFKQYWYPVRDINGFKQANLNGAINLAWRTNNVLFAVNTTERHRQAKAVLKAGSRILHEANIEIAPGRVYRKEIIIPDGIKETDLRGMLLDTNGVELIAYQPVAREPVKELPRAVKPPPPPAEIKTVEELYLTGLRVEQIHNPTVDPARYYQEALKRDPGDSRANTAMGLHWLKRGRYDAAEKHFRTAIERISAEYTRPINTETHYYLGLALRAQEHEDDAYTQFYRASWDSAWRGPAFYQLAELSCRKKLYDRALEEINEALAVGVQNTKARNLKAAILRKLERWSEAEASAGSALRIDPLDPLAQHEQRLARKGRESAWEQLPEKPKWRGDVQTYLEVATDYMNLGMYPEMELLLRELANARVEFASTYPMVDYYLGYAMSRQGKLDQAQAFWFQARGLPADYCFPFRLEEADVLNAVLRVYPDDARAHYYLGNLLYEMQPDKAIECWEKSQGLDVGFATVHRNLGWGYYRHKNDLTNAVACYEQAIACDGQDPRLLTEMDALYEFANVAPERRLKMLAQHEETVRRRGECLARLITVEVLTEKYDAAIGRLATNFFHVREGGGEIHDVYVDAHLLKGLQCQQKNDTTNALHHFEKAADYPENLSVGRPKRDRRTAQIAYLTGTAHEAAGNDEKAKASFRQAAEQTETRGWPDAQYYQALSWQKLGEQAKATEIFQRLVENGAKDLKQGETSDFFAKFGEQETRQTRKAAAHFTQALGYLGQGDREKAREQLSQAVSLNQSHVWARQLLRQL